LFSALNSETQDSISETIERKKRKKEGERYLSSGHDIWLEEEPSTLPGFNKNSSLFKKVKNREKP
jgi:hypothetical protein